MLLLETSIETLSPLAISSRRAVGFDLDTQLYIPGTALRGALAEAYLEQGGSVASAAFRTVFVDEQVRFCDHRLGAAQHWPLSVRQCANRGEQHPLVDLLLRAARNETLTDRCSKCHAKLEHAGGFFGPAPRDAENVLAGVAVASYRVAHSAIDPETLTTAPAQFFSTRLVASGQVFLGRIIASDAAEEHVLEILERIRQRDNLLYLGRGRTRGQGRSAFSWRRIKPPPVQPLLERVKELNARAGIGECVLFSATLQSATLLYDQWLGPRPCLTAQDIDPALGDYHPLGTPFLATQLITGWHAAAGLPKSESVALAPGSCFLFSRSMDAADAETEYQRLAHVLAGAELHGVGERLSEGFGEIVFASEAHILLA